ncbi:terminase small subunit [Nitratireductor rhodophyticola]|uniref:terminase small subunit n=1 Tax=Nitratireductor rhodophyticola TaxID=2854036 RepID=UPI002AC95FDE|nr:terminase small subunit [Nitratireductor rhodophyticola]WPZ13244.1 terminase small subunit [Nitratireductor rhodophyticola]
MPVLKNAKHEAFAQGLAKGLSASEAYVSAGYKESRSAASRLSTNVNVQRRVSELQGKAAEKAEWSAAERLSSLKAIHDRTSTEDPRVAISAIGEANKMQGSHAAAKHHLSGTVQVVTITAKHLDGLNDDELAALEAAYPVLQKLGLIGSDQGAAADAGSEPDD